MAPKTYTVRNPKTGRTFTIEGSSLKDALKKACLNPTIWLPVEETEDPTKIPNGKD